MITLNTDKGLVKISSWQDVIERPGFTSRLNTKKEKLKAIIGNYTFGDKKNCGLSNCNTAHNNGYLVVTNTGVETNIGKDCGMKYFGVEFQNQKKIYDASVTEMNNRERLWEFNFQLDELNNVIEQIDSSAYGARWCYATLSMFSHPTSGIPDRIRDHLYKMKKQRSSELVREYAISKEEISSLKNSLGSKYGNEIMGNLSGFSALYHENEIRELLVSQIKKPISNFEKLDIDSLSQKELKHAVKMISKIDSSMDNLRGSVIDHVEFLKPQNIKQLEYLLVDKDEKERLHVVVSNLAKSIKKESHKKRTESWTIEQPTT